MQNHPVWRASAALILLATLVPASLQSSQSQLLPPINPPDADAFGKVELAKVGNQQSFEVTAEKLSADSPPGPFEVWLETAVASGSFSKVDVMTLVSATKGRWELHLEATGGAPPALGVADVDDTAGRVVQVRDTGGVNVYLTGVVLASDANTCTPSGPTVQGTMDLTRPESRPDADAFGDVHLAKKGKKHELEVKTKNLDGGAAAPYALHLETAVGSGVFNAIAPLSPKPGALGRYELELESQCVPPAILGVANLSDLTGRKVQVRDAADKVVLATVCPELVTAQGKLNFNHKGKLELPNNPPSPKASGDVRVKFVAPQGQSSFELHVKNLAKNNTYALFMEDGVASGVFVKAGDLAFKGNNTKNGEYEVDTKNGAPLPFFVPKVGDLKDRLLQIRDATDVVHLVGQVP